MIKYIEFPLFAFICVFLPATLWHGVLFFLGEACDPKFGCFGVFKLQTMIAAIYASISAISLWGVYYLFVVRKDRHTIAKRRKLLIFSGPILGMLSTQGMMLAEYAGITLAVGLWCSISCVVGWLALCMTKDSGMRA